MSTAGAATTQLAGHGRELFYIDLAGTLLGVDVDVDASATLQLSTPQPLLPGPISEFGIYEYMT